MTNNDKVEKAIDLINKAELRDERVRPEDIYESMIEYSPRQVAVGVAAYINLIHDLKEVLEAD